MTGCRELRLEWRDLRLPLLLSDKPSSAPPRPSQHEWSTSVRSLVVGTQGGGVYREGGGPGTSGRSGPTDPCRSRETEDEHLRDEKVGPDRESLAFLEKGVSGDPGLVVNASLSVTGKVRVVYSSYRIPRLGS